MSSKSIGSILKRLILIISISIFTILMTVILISEFYQFKKDFKSEKQLIEGEKKLFLKIAVQNVKSYLEYANSTADKKMKEKLKNAVYNALNQAQTIYHLNKNSRTEAEIKELVKNTLRELRYFDGRGYIYLIDMDGKLLMYPHKSISEGCNLLGIHDSTGKSMIKEQLEIIKNKDEAFHTYYWTKPWTNDTTFHHKTSFVKRLEPFGWLIGCGEYSDDHLIKTQQEALDYLKNSYSPEDWNLFINHYDGTSIIINSNKYKAGVNIKDISDDNGLKVFEEELKIAQSGKPDYLNYSWPVSKNKYTPKLAYIDRFEKWNWMIGASSSLQKVDSYELQRTKTFYKISWLRILVILLLSIPFVLFIFNQIRKTKGKLEEDFNFLFKQIEVAVSERKSPFKNKYRIAEFSNVSEKIDQLLSKHLSNIKALKESEEKFRILVEHAPLVIVGFDNQGIIRIWNKQCEKFFDLEQKTVLNKPAPLDILLDNEAKKRVLKRMITNDPEFKLVPIKLKNGKSAYQYWASFKISDNLNIWVGNDVTKLKETENELLRSRNFLDTLLESIPSPIFYKSISGEYLGGNKAYFNLVGKEKEEILGKGVHELFPERLANFYYEKDQEVFGGRCSQYEFVFGTDENHTRNYTFYKAPFKNNEGKVEGLICVMLDITDRIQIEEELKSNQEKLKALNATKDKFFSIIAHDLINPFNVMINSGAILAESLREKDLAEAEDMINMLNPAIKNAYDLLVNLLEWARSQTGRIKILPKKVKIEEELNPVVDLMTDLAKAKNIKLIKEISYNPEINIDTNMFETIARNLISNAIKFTPEGGRIVVDTAHQGEYVKFSVKDNGIGMDKEMTEKLFQIDKSITRNGTNEEPGTGLGLFLVNDFVQMHNGKITVDSQVGEWTNISVWFPLKN
jgi:PAS domain S-box-containing protein